MAAFRTISLEDGHPAHLYFEGRRQDPTLFRFRLKTAHRSEHDLTLAPLGLLDRLAIQLGGADIQTGDADFDRTFRVDGRCVTDAQALLSTDIRGRLLEMRQRQPFHLAITPTEITLIWAAGPRENTQHIEAFCRLLQALRAHDTAEWRAAADRRSLSFDAQGCAISGVLSGVPITATLTHHRGALFTEITVPVAADFTARHPDRQGWRLWRRLTTGNPVLDMLVAIDGAPHAIDRLKDADLAESLMAVVHRWPGSTVSPGGITLRAPGRLTADLGEALDAAAALGAHLAA